MLQAGIVAWQNSLQGTVLIVVAVDRETLRGMVLFKTCLEPRQTVLSLLPQWTDIIRSSPIGGFPRDPTSYLDSTPATQRRQMTCNMT